MWWGGSSAPARSWCRSCRACAPMVAALGCGRRPRARFLWTTLTASLVDRDWRPVDPDGCCSSAILAARAGSSSCLQGPAPLAALLPPSRRKIGCGPLLGLLPWLMAAGLTRPLFSRSSGAGTMVATLAAGICSALDFLAAASVLADEASRRGAPGGGAPGASTSCGSTTRSACADSTTRRCPRPIRTPCSRSSRIVVEASGRRTRLNVSWWVRVSFPAGSYQARIWFAEGSGHDGEVVVSSSDRAV